MASSTGAAAAQGLESGFGLGLRLFDQQDQKVERERRAGLELQDRADRLKQRDFENQRQVTQDNRLARADDRQATMDSLKLFDSDIADLSNEGTALFSQYGGYDKVPEDVRTDYTNRVRTARQKRAEARRKVFEPNVLEQKRDAAEKWSRIQAGQMSVDDLSDDDLYRTLTVMSRRDLGDFLAPASGGPSKIQQAGLDLEAGIKTGNQDLTLKAANVLLAPELRTGIGSEARDGSEIVDKKIVQLVPHPNDPNQIVPILEVTVKRPDGAVGRYLAPVTQDRGTYSGNPGAMPKTITLQDAFDRVGQLTTLGEALNRPDIRARVEKGREGAGPQATEFLQALTSVGVKAPTKQVTRDKLDLGDRVVERELDPSGKIVGQTEYRKGAVPKAGRGGGGGGGLGLGAAMGDDDEESGEDFLAKLSKADQLIVKGLADGSIKPDSISTKGNRREQMLAYAKRYTAGADLTGRKPDQEKPLPAKQQSLLTEARSNASTMGSLLESWKPEYASKGVLGLGAELSMGAKSVLGTDKESVDWWKNYRKMGELVERHAMFGASLTAAEQGSWRSADIGPGMDADVIKKNLATREMLARKVLEATEEDLIDAGYGEDRIRKIARRDTKVPLGTNQPAAPAPGAAPAASPPARPRTKAEFDSLPSGTLFVDPNGVTRRKP